VPEFKCKVRETVAVTIPITIVAKTKKEAAQIARNAWVNMAEGKEKMQEEVEDRWVEVDGDFVETEGD